MSDRITDVMVEVVARVLYRNQTGTDLLDTSGYRDGWSALARRALEAAFAAEQDVWEYAWEADPEKRALMSPQVPRYLIDGYVYTPETGLWFPRGARVRRRKAGPWDLVPEQEGEGS